MDQTVKQQWVAALRCGTYVQCTGELRNSSDEYCVLGVLCDLHDQASPHAKDEPPAWQQLGKRWSWFYLNHHEFPSDEVCKWADTDGDALLIVEQLNDGRGTAGLSFEELALYIEENL